MMHERIEDQDERFENTLRFFHMMTTTPEFPENEWQWARATSEKLERGTFTLDEIETLGRL